MLDDLINYAAGHKAWIVTAGATIGWIATAIKWWTERKKLNLEVRKLVGEQLEQLHECDDSHRESDKRFCESSRIFLLAYGKTPIDSVELEAARESLCGALTDLIHRYVVYCDVYCHVYQDDPARLTSFLDSAIRDIRIWGRCQGSLNHPNVIASLPVRREPFRISKHTLVQIRHAVDKLRRVPAQEKEALNRELDILLQAGVQ